MISAPAATTTPGSCANQVSWSMKLLVVISLPGSGHPAEVPAELGDRDHGLLTADHVADGDRAGLVLGAAVDQAPPGALFAGPPELPAELAGRAQVDAGPQPGGAGHRGEAE